MGTIVTLPPRRTSRATAPQTSDATILLFMGVRYVRDLDAAGVAEPAAPELQPEADDDELPLEIA